MAYPQESSAKCRGGQGEMIDFYALTSPNVQKIFIALEELGLPYKVHPVDVWKGEQFSPEFLKINPNAKIPVIVDHEGPGGKPYTVFESGAILLYLAEKTGKLLPTEMAARYEVIQWLMIQLTGIGPMSGQLVHFKRFAPGVSDYALSRYQTEVKRLYELLEKRLGQVAYFSGAEYSIADIAIFPWTRTRDLMGVSWSDHPNLGRWFEKISARPAVKAALAKVETITSSRDNAKPEDLDRFFGRGKFARA
jgi:GSH-dependent disulfide-bond oxidoreductase